MRACFGEFNAKKLTELSPWLIDKWRANRLKEGLKPATLNRDLVALKAALSKALDWHLIDAHPLKDVKPAKVDHGGVVRFLDDQEETRLRQALALREQRIRRERDNANAWRRDRGYPLLPDLHSVAFVDHLQPLVLLAMNTGLRRGELFNLAWENIDLERARLTIIAHHAKSGKARYLPLNQEALTVLKGWRGQTANRTGLVFPGKAGRPLDNVNSAWEKVLADACIQGFRWHDLRHHFASRLVMSEVDLNTVRELLGHGDIKMTLRYAHLAPEHKAAAVAKLDQARLITLQRGARHVQPA
ncbi:MAG: site-specific integrase [Gammaproteobacteria bacterium]